MVTSNVLCGLVVPVAFFPDWLRVLAYATPFPEMLQTPVNIAVERVSGVDALVAVGIQLAWAVAMLAAGVLVLRRGTRRLVVQGG
jgi:ABC-2 type transport system permease protein